ncbi:2-C-methyl-D-erythritol 4-phosphate cytidylyltransferase [Sphingobacterium spiritivorum]|uniref:2-C-methyl-D-erythritol 4-phosphate cytidylyltransferase n=1 Tax=Sphingobacterium spiritivorum TaxID=258 RepID=UPI003DA5BB96
MAQQYVIIVAGGTGSRMNQLLPKQYLILEDKPVLMHTIQAFYSCNTKPHIVLVLHPDMESLWTDLCMDYHFDIPHDIVYGGATRFQSVRNGLTYICTRTARPSEHLIAVHDAARPLIRPEIIDHAYELAALKKAVVVAVKSTNSIRLEKEKDGKLINLAYDRDQVWMVQTPQTFNAELLFKAYQQKESALFTDDASVVEQSGHPVTLLEGHHSNLKITYPEDIQIAQLYLNNLRG